MVRSELALAQTNAESERSLSINARLVTKDRASLCDTTIVGLRAVKVAVRFHDEVNHQPKKNLSMKDVKHNHVTMLVKGTVLSVLILIFNGVYFV